jgi:hypothetical protein
MLLQEGLRMVVFVTQREDIMRAALEYIADFGHSPIRHAREALAAVDALPESDTERVREGWAAYGTMAVRAEAAEARLAQIAELSECVRLNIKRDYLSAAEGQITRIQRIARGGEEA